MLPGLEQIAGREITSRLDGLRLIDQQRGWIVFTFEGDPTDLLELRTTEDVFVLLYRAADLPPFRHDALPLLTRMAAGSRYWEQALTCFQRTRRPVQRITFRVIAQMTGQTGFRRQEMRDAVLAGVQARWPKWKPVADDAHLEIWAPTINQWTLIAIRLSDRQMRHRAYKQEHLPASLRPTLAAAMVMLSKPRPDDRFCDPMCGAGTILAERAAWGPYRAILGGDVDAAALDAAQVNLGRVQQCALIEWDAHQLPIGAASLDAVVCNLPFGIKIGSPAENPALYGRFFQQLGRILVSGGRAVLLTSEKELMHTLIHQHPQFALESETLVGVLGQAARIYVLRNK